jgi:23S rRNA (pseudouridine1915-N3)-methyltransferase
MAKLTFITFGKIKNPNLKELSEYYQLLLSKYVKVDFRVLNDVNERQIEVSDLKTSIRELGYTIAVTEKGKDFTTEGFNFFVDKRFRYENNVTFIIGNAFGMHPEFLQRCDYTLALSKMTFTHEMATVILLEQLYRVLNITSGGSYHK